MESDRTDQSSALDEERRIREAALDKTLADTFPASDPLSSNPNPRDYSIASSDAEPLHDARQARQPRAAQGRRSS